MRYHCRGDFAFGDCFPGTSCRIVFVTDRLAVLFLDGYFIIDIITARQFIFAASAAGNLVVLPKVS